MFSTLSWKIYLFQSPIYQRLSFGRINRRVIQLELYLPKFDKRLMAKEDPITEKSDDCDQERL